MCYNDNLSLSMSSTRLVVLDCPIFPWIFVMRNLWFFVKILSNILIFKMELWIICRQLSLIIRNDLVSYINKSKAFSAIRPLNAEWPIIRSLSNLTLNWSKVGNQIMSLLWQTTNRNLRLKLVPSSCRMILINFALSPINLGHFIRFNWLPIRHKKWLN